MNNKEEIVLTVSIEDLKNSIEELTNGNNKFLSILDNLFLINNINTCFHVEENVNFLENNTAEFEFSYNDSSFDNLFVIQYEYDDDSCYAFLSETDFINEEQLNSINEKVINSIDSSIINNYEKNKKFDEMLYNEAVLIIAGGINKEDFNSVKSNFESSYEAWKNRKEDINYNGVELLKALYNKLLKIKLNERN